MSKEFSRVQRVSGLIQRELANIIHREIHDPNLGIITVSRVQMSPDLKYARVYVTLLGGCWSVEQAIQHFNERTGLLRHHLSQRLTIRTTPRLQFIHDSAIEEGNRLSALIDSVTTTDNGLDVEEPPKDSNSES